MCALLFPRIAAETAAVDMSELYGRFLQHIPAGGRILDASCGVGRDAAAFAERGYDVVAIDASAEMVRLTQQHVGDRAVRARDLSLARRPLLRRSFEVHGDARPLAAMPVTLRASSSRILSAAFARSCSS